MASYTCGCTQSHPVGAKRSCPSDMDLPSTVTARFTCPERAERTGETPTPRLWNEKDFAIMLFAKAKLQHLMFKKNDDSQFTNGPH